MANKIAPHNVNESKTISTLTVKLELDTNDLGEQIREFLEKAVSDQFKKELMPGGLLWGR